MVSTQRAKLEGTEEDTRLHFWCPGCDEVHSPRVKGVNPWTWNDNLEFPTLQPSVLLTQGDHPNDFRPKSRCHSYVINGQIQFLTDSTHALAGQTVDLPTRDKWRYE